MGRVAHVTAEAFESLVLRSTLPVLVEFWASWCLPCRAVDPVLNQLSQELAGCVTIAKVQVDQNPGLREAYEIHGVPTFALFQSGGIVARSVGSQSKGQLLRMIDDALESG